MFRKVLIANRGAIACRIIRTLRRMGIQPVAVYSEADRHSLHVEQAGEAWSIGPAPAAQSYLSIAALMEAARGSGAEAIHPGYGFLSENAAFAEACAENGMVFIGPTPAQMRDFGLKHTARRIAQENGLPLLPGTGLLATVDEAAAAADRIGWPVMLKSTAGGGGIGMRVCRDAAELGEAYAAVERLSQASFGAAGIYLEKFVAKARHIEVQIFGDGRGEVIALGERDCSAQRRHQKVIEETPAPGLATETRARLADAAVRLGQAVRYQSAGTVEFIYDDSTGGFYFLEVNTRLQVEHGVTEEVTGVDLVEWMVRQAADEMPDLATMAVAPHGCSMQARVYAEDAGRDFQPSSGRLMHVGWPGEGDRSLTVAAPNVARDGAARDGAVWDGAVWDGAVWEGVAREGAARGGAFRDGARIETWVKSGTEVTPYYDPMLAKIIVHADSRDEALQRLRTALAECRMDGIETNLEYLRQVCASREFRAGGIATAFLRDFPYRRHAIDVIAAGTQTTIQDYPGRIGYWHVGVPPSGPMDSLAFRWANRLVGNAESAAGLEITVTGPTLRFRSDTVIALTGADFGARLDGMPVARWQPVEVKAGAVLEMGTVEGAGARGCLAAAGGIDAPRYLGSASTFILGRFGGCFGRVLRAGDVLPVNAGGERRTGAPMETPDYSHEWEIGVLYGPHGAPDFFTPRDIETFFSTSWRVHHNSDRTGVRLIGPKPEWARPDGGEAGLHPSNIHDNAYAVGTIDFTGDMPVILGPDGPSLGGFVCPATIVDAELWKIGQLKPGDTVRFRAVSLEQAREMQAALDAGCVPRLPERPKREEAILCSGPAVILRADGDQYLLLEYGPNVLDLNLRFRVHALESQLRALALDGILDITPGVRSLHIHYDGRRLRREALLEALDDCERRIPDLDDIVRAVAHRSPAALVGRSGHAAGDPEIHAIGAAGCAVVPEQHRVHPPHQRPRVHRRCAPHRLLGQLPGAGPGRCVPGRAGGHAHRSAPSPGDDQVQPGAHLDAGERRGHRRRVPVRVRHGGSGRLSVRGAHGADVEHRSRGVRPGTPWLLRFFDQIRFYPVGRGGTAGNSRRVSARAVSAAHREPGFPAGGLPCFSRIDSGRGRGVQAAAAGGVRGGAGALGGGRSGVRPGGNGASGGGGWRAGGMPPGVLAGERERVEHRSGGGTTCGGGRAAGGAGSHEDGNRGGGPVCGDHRNAQLRARPPGGGGATPGDGAGGDRMRINLGALREMYRSGEARPCDVVAAGQHLVTVREGTA